MPPTLTITPLIVTLDVGESLQLQVSPNPNGVKWSCADCHIASVTNEGLVTGLAEGSTIITGRRGNQSVSVSVTVADIAPPPEPVPDPPTLAFAVVTGHTIEDLWRFSTLGTAPAPGDVIVASSINFGDGTPLLISPGLPPNDDIVHTFAVDDDYTITFSIETQFGYLRSMTLTVTVAPAPPPDPPDPPDPIPPTATLAFISGQFAGQPVSFAVGAFDTDGTIAAHSLQYGDGAGDTAPGPPPTTAQHVYAAPGTYTVVLTVTDDDGLLGTSSIDIVLVAAPTVNQPPVAVIQLVSGGFVGNAFTFSTSGSFDPEGPLASWAFQAGNGQAQGNTGAPPATITQLYPTQGTFTVRLTVMDTGGLSHTDELIITVSAPPPPGNYTYFNTLIARPDRLFERPLRSQAELDTYPNGGNWTPVGSAFYDPVVDALQQRIDPLNVLGPSGRPGSGNTPRQELIPFNIPFGLTFLHTWDSRYEQGFAWVNQEDYFRVYKSYRWDLPSGTDGPPLWITMKHHWKVGALAGHLAEYAVTLPSLYFAGAGVSIGATETLQPQTQFFIEADRWIRTWVYYNATDQKLSVWAADSVQGVVQLVNQVNFIFPPSGIFRWRIEYDTSQNTFSSHNPLSRLWNRNVVVLRDLSYATTQSLLSIVGL